MIRRIYQDPFLRFIFLAGGLYLAWYLFYELWIHPWKEFDLAIIGNLIWIAGGMLKFLGYELIPPPPPSSDIRTIGIDGSQGVWVGDPCDGITLFALFTIFVLAYPGPIKKKAWFIPFGLITIHLLNAVRVMVLAMIAKFEPAYLDFNHTYTFTVIVYSYVFLLWYLWATKFSGIGLGQKAVNRE